MKQSLKADQRRGIREENEGVRSFLLLSAEKAWETHTPQ